MPEKTLIADLLDGNNKPRTRAKSLHSESKLQKSCVTYFRYQYAQFRDLLFSVPNGGLRKKTEAKILKAEGATAGIPDLILAVARGGFHGMFIEMKFGDNKLSDNQQKIIPQLEAQGYKVVICYTFEEFCNAIEIYLNESL